MTRLVRRTKSNATTGLGVWRSRAATTASAIDSSDELLVRGKQEAINRRTAPPLDRGRHWGTGLRALSAGTDAERDPTIERTGSPSARGRHLSQLSHRNCDLIFPPIQTDQAATTAPTLALGSSRGAAIRAMPAALAAPCRARVNSLIRGKFAHFRPFSRPPPGVGARHRRARRCSARSISGHAWMHFPPDELQASTFDFPAYDARGVSFATISIQHTFPNHKKRHRHLN